MVYLHNEILYSNENKGHLLIITRIKCTNIMLSKISQIQNLHFVILKCITSESRTEKSTCCDRGCGQYLGDRTKGGVLGNRVPSIS